MPGRKNPALMLSVALALVLAAGCSDDDNGTRPDSHLPVADTSPDRPATDLSVIEGGSQEGSAGAAQYGDTCDPSSEPCASGLSCQLSTVASKYFCTVECTNLYYPCTKTAPAGAAAYCLLPAATTADGGSKYYCLFMCKTKSASYTCPSELKCSTTENPAGSGQYPCEPK